MVEHLKKTDGHASDIAKLVPEDSSNGESLGATLSREVVRELHMTAIDWDSPEHEQATPAAQ